jgi:hypothetical protein
MSSQRNPTRWRIGVLSLGLIVSAGTVVACGLPTPIDRAKKLLTKHGSIAGEWEIHDDVSSRTLTYLVLRTDSGAHETYELAVADGERVVTRELAGGIDGTGCFLTPYGLTTPWMVRQEPKVLQGARKRGDKTRTGCLEYQGTAAWTAIPEKDRKAAEPPPPPPPAPTQGPDAGTPDAGAKPADKGEVKSAMP